MTPTVAVLGPGAVGGAVAVLLLEAGGRRVVCVGREPTVAAIRERGLVLERGSGAATFHPEAVERLDRSVDLLVVAVKATGLDGALERIDPHALGGAVVVPLLNGLEHLEPIRRRLGAPVVAGSISRFQARLAAPGHVVLLTGTARITLASDAAAGPLAVPGIEIRVEPDERAVLWKKAARLGVLAAATAASGATIGALRDDPAWRSRLERAVAEACAVAAADGVPLDPADQWEIIEAMDAGLTTSTARDVAAGRPSELDAVTGSIVRAARRHGVPSAALNTLYADARSRAVEQARYADG